MIQKRVISTRQSKKTDDAIVEKTDDAIVEKTDDAIVEKTNGF
jgi:hypothetical protein